MILIASTSRGEVLRGLKSAFAELAVNMDLDINLRKIREEDLGPEEGCRREGRLRWPFRGGPYHGSEKHEPFLILRWLWGKDPRADYEY